METVSNLIINNEGITGKYCENIAQRWLIGILESNPAILSIFKDRDVKPYRDLLAWQGEFAGKYLTSAYYAYKQTSNEELKEYALSFIAKMLALQSEDGYLGCYSRETRFTGALPQTPQNIPWTWDCWAHYHISYALLLWYKETGNKEYLMAAGDLNLYEPPIEEYNGYAFYHGFGSDKKANDFGNFVYNDSNNTIILLAFFYHEPEENNSLGLYYNTENNSYHLEDCEWHEYIEMLFGSWYNFSE